MNIFRVHDNPIKAAQALGDKHVVKMVLETAQLLSTAHRVLDGQSVIEMSKTGRKITRYMIPDLRNCILYQATHVNHPSAVWVRQNNWNYYWAFDHFIFLLEEYKHRYNKEHKCFGLVERLRYPPKNIPLGKETPIPCVMPPEYIISDDPVENYRSYYRKGKKDMHKWTGRDVPSWI